MADTVWVADKAWVADNAWVADEVLPMREQGGTAVVWDGPGGTYTIRTHLDVYRPSHDTYLLAHAVADEIRPGERFLEVGCGAGLVAIVAARKGATVTATDLNPEAVRLAAANARLNEVSIDVRHADLMEALDRGDPLEGLDGVDPLEASGPPLGPLDVVAFNPPYLPTGPEDVLPGPINLAFDGGRDGNETVLRFAQQLARLTLLPRCILVVHSSLADPSALQERLGALGYTAHVVAVEAHFFERIQVLRFTLG